ncbi:hypothetical protein OIU77_010268 [Salix suchowensis]|uniref:Uncharacterized protein n=1 Tax=Salix suchowensis TaxID=1278906 RepID=A0ABQ9A8Y7_9ROSI|nr:hypothetical protein OIU77_010268 [Salix suchowensis]
MYETRTIQVPGPFKVGPLTTSGSYIMMEFIEFGVCRGNQMDTVKQNLECHGVLVLEDHFTMLILSALS